MVALQHPQINRITPTLFDAAADSSLILPLVLANAASSRLWRLKDRLLGEQQERAPAAEPVELLQTLQAGLNRMLTHVSPLEVAETNGCLRLADLAQRLGEHAVAETTARILAMINAALASGQLDPARYDLAPLIAAGSFPAYTYGTVDVIAATGRYLGRPSRRPFGMTCCLDEVALFAALLLIQRRQRIDGVAMLANPCHYSLFGWCGAQSWWFYGKNELFLTVGLETLEQRLADPTTLVTRRGSWQRSSGSSSIPAAELEAMCQRLQAFFGGLPAGLEPQQRRALIPLPASPMDVLVERVMGCASAAAVQAVLRAALAEAEPLANAARTVLTMARDLAGLDLEQVLLAAREGVRLRQALAALQTPALHTPALQTPAAARAVVAAIAGNTSIFADAGRLAMPEETLKFSTGSHADKALLLHVLLEQCHGIGAVTTVFEAQTSVVLSPEGAFCTATMQWQEPDRIERPAITGGLVRRGLLPLQPIAKGDEPGSH